MPFFDVKRCRAWFAKEYADFGYETLEAFIAEFGEALQKAAPTPDCLTMRMLVGEKPVTGEAHDPQRCGRCRNMLRYLYILYATKKEMEPYFKVVAQKNGMTATAAHRALTMSVFKGGGECFDAVEAVNFDVLPPERKEHRADCVKCNLRVDLWDAMGDIALRR
ncbi:MAG: hypothetical protein HYW56_00075 [Candidatus Harrisonbacteria bacterium]|nr:hypothetical protein [Candidatus Harrisonbacteria bacterium]MBI2603926.1 hypothetical protein [Candidatus Harrisonbacteria bacterium]